MELYVIRSEHHETPLAEIRTDGRNIDWIVDNSRGKLKQVAQGDFEALKAFIDKTSHMIMEVPEGPTPGLLRYSLENGDIVEITTDGKTAMLNGSVLEYEHKMALMSAINSGQLKVKGRADLKTPLPIKPKPKTVVSKELPKSEVNKSFLDEVKRKQKKEKSKNAMGRYGSDAKIEDIDFSDSHCPAMGKQLLYLLKYGDDHA